MQLNIQYVLFEYLSISFKVTKVQRFQRYIWKWHEDLLNCTQLNTVHTVGVPALSLHQFGGPWPEPLWTAPLWGSWCWLKMSVNLVGRSQEPQPTKIKLPPVCPSGIWTLNGPWFTDTVRDTSCVFPPDNLSLIGHYSLLFLSCGEFCALPQGFPSDTCVSKQDLVTSQAGRPRLTIKGCAGRPGSALQGHGNDGSHRPAFKQ